MTQFDPNAPGGAGFGMRLREAREAAGLSEAEVSKRLRMPRRVVQALEADDWTSLGAPVFVRGQLRSYAKLLGLNFDRELDDRPDTVPTAPELVSHTHTPRYRRALEQVGRRAMYIVLTAAIAVPVWLQTRPHLERAVSQPVAPLDPPAMPTRPAQAVPKPSARVATVSEPTPVVASMAPLPPRERPRLSVEFTAPSWVEVFDRNDALLEKGTVAAGQRRSFELGDVGRIKLGNRAGVQVRLDGEPVDLAPYSQANVTHFTLSSDGSLAPVSR